jgi:hypothetical protein
MKTMLINFLCISTLFIFSGCNNGKSDYSEKKETEEASLSKEDLVKRGEYLVTIIGCDHCHSPKKMTEKGPITDMDRRFMGFPATDSIAAINKEELGPGKWMLMNGDLTAFVGPWGISYGANITSHETGIGTWSYEQFKKSVTEGKYKGMENSRPVMPPMPWESFSELQEDDLKAIYEFLMTTKPIENVVPAYIPPSQ